MRSAVPHPKIMGIIRECGGKMHMSEGKQGMYPAAVRVLLTHESRELEERPERLLRIIPELRRSRLSAAHSGAEVPSPDDDVDGLRHQPV